MTDTTQLPPHTITINDHPEPHIMQWSDLELAAIKKYAESYALQAIAQATQADVTDGIRPEDFTVDVVVKSMGGFAQINTKGVRVTHKPTGISVTCDVARSQHANRNQAFEKLSAILATPTAQAHPAEVTDEREAFESCALMEGSLFKRRADDPDKYWDGNVQDDWELWQARAILALRPERVPMTDEQRECFNAGYESAQQEALVCRLPPAGWACTRTAGHEGPCAAVPTDDEALVKRGMDRLREAHHDIKPKEQA